MSDATPPSWEQVLALVHQFDEGGAEEVHLEVPGLRLFMSRRTGAVAHDGAAAAVDGPAAASSQVDTAPGAERAAGDRQSDDQVAVTAPMLGVFYRAPSPGALPFVEVGQRVAPDDTVALLEVMKLFNAVTAGVAGTVVRFAVNDGEMVEHGQPLVYVDVDAPIGGEAVPGGGGGA